MSKQQPLNIGISTHDFLHLPGARDLLRMIIRGLKLKTEHQLYLLMDTGPDEDIHRWSNSIIGRLQKIVRVPELAQLGMRKIERILRRCLLIFVLPKNRSTLRRKAAEMLGSDIVENLKILPFYGVPEGVETVCRQHKIDVIIPTTFNLQIPFVSYLYDCQHKHFPENFNHNDCILRDNYFQKLIDSSPALIVNSRNAKQDLLTFFRADDQQIIPLPFTPQLDESVLDERPDLLTKYRLPAKFFMVSNQFWVHKSLETALEALRLLLDTGLDDCHIVFTGQMEDTRFPEYVPKLMRQVEEMKLQEHTSFLGYIPKRDQLEIMKHSVAVVQTTLFEGGPGGGSIYDAASLGVRAIVSDIPINHELPVGDKLVLFKAKNAKDLANKMRVFWNNNYNRPNNQKLRENAERLLEAYSECLYGAIEQAISSPLPNTHKQKTLKISIITAVKNTASTLHETMESVFNQSYQHLEYIVIDGGSTDGTLDIVKGYGDKVKYISEPDDGIYDAMNKGVAMATGDVLYFLNAGDTLHDQHVFTDVMSVISDPTYRKYGFFYGNVQFLNPDGSDGRKLEYRTFPFYYYADNCQCHQVCFYRREMFDRFGNYDLSFKVYGDQEFNARLVVKNKVPSFHMGRYIVRYPEGGFSEQMLASGLNAQEKIHIKKLYFGDTPDWFFDRLKSEQL